MELLRHRVIMVCMHVRVNAYQFMYIRYVPLYTYVRVGEITIIQ